MMAMSGPIPIKQTQIVQRFNTYTYTQYVLSPLNPIKSLLLMVKITIVNYYSNPIFLWLLLVSKSFRYFPVICVHITKSIELIWKYQSGYILSIWSYHQFSRYVHMMSIFNNLPFFEDFETSVWPAIFSAPTPARVIVQSPKIIKLLGSSYFDDLAPQNTHRLSPIETLKWPKIKSSVI